MSIISAGTTLTTALVQTGDTNGNLVFRTGASGTTALTLGSDQSATFAGAVSFSGGATLTNPTINGNVTTTGLNFDSNTFVIDAANNRVGVGTASPGTALVVASATSATALTVSNSSGGSEWQQAGNDLYISNYNASGADIFRTNGTERMRIDSSGNVGIGTSSIASGGAGTTNFNVHTPSANTVYFKLSNAGTGNTASDGFDLLTDSSGVAYVWNRENQSLLFGTNNTERMRIESNGVVGIGVTNPQDVLDLARASGTTAIRMTSQGVGSLTWRIASQITGVSNTGFAIRDETNAANRLTIDGSGNLAFNSGYGSAAIAYGCRAWVNFNGTGTVAIRASGNVSSITDNGTGDYTVNFSTAMPDANYAVTGSALGSNGNWAYTVMTGYTTTLAAGSVRFRTGYSNAESYFDIPYVSITVVR